MSVLQQFDELGLLRLGITFKSKRLINIKFTLLEARKLSSIFVFSCLGHFITIK